MQCDYIHRTTVKFGKIGFVEKLSVFKSDLKADSRRGGQTARVCGQAAAMLLKED